MILVHFCECMQDIKQRIDRLIVLPTVILNEEDTTQIQAAGVHGAFCHDLW